MSKQIVSPIPGTFYRRPAPEKPPYKEEGDTVASGEAIGLVEVMKSFYEVKAEAAGKIARFLVEDGDEVQAGQPLVDLA